MSKDDSFDRIKKLVAPFGKPAIHLVGTSDKTGFSKIGGKPIVPDEFEWPEWKDLPLSFIMQLKFSEINGDGYIPDFPTSGLLYVFYEQARFADGLDPLERDSWRVLYYPETDKLRTKLVPKEVYISYREKMLSRQIITTYPACDSEILEEALAYEESYSAYNEYKYSAFGANPHHQVGGYSDGGYIDDMDLVCELASNGIDIKNGSNYNKSRVETLAPNRDEWTLLLQVDKDKDMIKTMDLSVGMDEDDCGGLYFWIRKYDLECLDFKDVWMVI